MLHALDAALYGPWAPGYHLTNILLHLLAAWSVALLLGAFFELDAARFAAAALLFGVAPAAWLPVGAISYRAELALVAGLGLLVHCHARARRGGQRRWFFGCALALAMALGAKETAVVVAPALVGLWELRAARRQRVLSGRRSALLALEAALLATYIGARWLAVPRMWRIRPPELGWSEALGTRLWAAGQLMIDVVAPWTPRLSDATEVVGLFDVRALGPSALLLAGTVVALRTARSSRAGTLAALGLVLSLPALNIVPLPRVRSPHYGYLPTIAWVGVLVVALGAVARRIGARGRIAAQLLIGGWAVAAALANVASGARWRDDAALFGPAVARDPRFAEAHSYLGDSALRAGAIERAGRHYAAALAPHPRTLAYVDRVSVSINLAAVRLRQNRPADAEQLLARAAAHAEPFRRPSIAYNRALIAARGGEDRRAIELLEPYASSFSRPEPLLLLARSLHRRGDRRGALRALRRARQVRAAVEARSRDVRGGSW